MSIRKLFKDSLIYGICNTLSKLFLVLLVPLYTRLLTQSEFGAFDLTLASIKILVVIAGLQIESGTARLFYEARDRGEEKRLVSTAFWTLWVLPLLGSSGIILCRKHITLYLFRQEHHVVWIVLAALIIPLMVQFFYTLVLFRLRNEKGRFLNFTLLNIGPASLIALVLVWKFDWGVTGILVGQLTGLTLGLGASLWTLRHYLRLSVSRSLMKELLFYGVPLLPAVASNWGQSYANRFFISGLLGLNSLGLYSLAVNVAGIIMLFQQAFALAWLPNAMWMMGQEGCENFFRRMLNIYAWVMGTLALALTLYAQELVALFGPSTYSEAARYIGFIVSAQALNGCGMILAVGNNMVKKTYWNSVGCLCGTACNLLGLYLTISGFGLAAAAVWFAFGVVVKNILILWTSQRNHFIPYNYFRYGFFVIFLGGIALWNLLSSFSLPISSFAFLIKAVVLAFGVVALAYILLDHQDRQKGLGQLMFRFGYQRAG